MKRILLINLKTYKEGTGKKAVQLAKTAKKISSKNVKVIFAVQPTDVSLVSKIIPTFSQHTDPIEYGAHTGHILPEAVKQAGAIGTLINHSEKRIGMKNIRESLERCKMVGLKTLVCASAKREGKEIARMNPDYLAFEDPALIGTLKSVSRMEPKSVKDFVDAVKRTNPKVIPLCGAGVANSEDVRMAIELGMEGVLLSTAVVKAENPARKIRELINGFG